MLLFCVAYIVALRKCKFCGADAREIKKNWISFKPKVTKSDLMMVSFDGKKTLYIKEYANVYGSDVGHRRMAKLPTIFQSCITIAQKIIATSCQEKQ